MVEHEHVWCPLPLGPPWVWCPVCGLEEGTKESWHVIPDCTLMAMLRRVEAGESPDMVFAEHYANAEGITTITPDWQTYEVPDAEPDRGDLRRTLLDRIVDAMRDADERGHRTHGELALAIEAALLPYWSDT